MNTVKFEKEPVEIDGILYNVSGSFDPEGSGVWNLQVYADNISIIDHLKDSVIEDLMTELVLRYSHKAGADEMYLDPEVVWNVEERR